MKIKSLLIGLAATAVAATGAKAADAVVVAEPEPVEYVRICDAYGVGFFYIPGTETCLRIEGYVWFQGSAHGYGRTSGPPGTGAGDTVGYYTPVAGVPAAAVPHAPVPGLGAPGAQFLRVTARGRVNFDARSDTELGTLRSYIRLQATGGANGGGTQSDIAATLDQAYIELGGFRMGYTEGAWAQTQGGGATNWGAHSWGGMYYGYQQRNILAYTFQGGNGFFGTLSLEDDAGAGNAYAPDVVVKVGVNQGWGSVWAKVAYDESFNGTARGVFAPFAGFAGTNSGGFGASLGMQFNIPNSPGSSLRLIGFYADGSHAFNVGGPSAIFTAGPAGGIVYGGAEWSILASYNHAFSSTLSASIAFQYFNDMYFNLTDVSSGVNAWGAEVSVVWFPVTNFEVRAEVHYDDVGAFAPPTAAGIGDPDGTLSGFLRFTRYF